MEISISTQSAFKSTLITYLVLILAIKVIAFWEISPLALLHALNYGLCMAKWEISNISLSVWLVGYLSHGILGNFAIGLAPCTIWCFKYGQTQNF